MAKNNPAIVPHLWFDTQALEAADFYTAIFPDARIKQTAVIENTPSGNCELVSFTLWGQAFEAISAGPQFAINPSISFIINFDPLLFGVCKSAKVAARETQQTVWDKLLEGGEILMPLDRYPFSECFGWVKDKFGISWQLILSRPEGDPRPPIVPSMLFTGENCGKAEQAVDFYISVFKNSQRGGLQRYGANQAPNQEGTVMFSDARLDNFWIAAIDSAEQNAFNFNEAVSFIVYCNDQDEIDYYWQHLNAMPDTGQCGWLKDKYGVSWQILPAIMKNMLYEGSQQAVNQMMATALTMKKIDIVGLQHAFKTH